VGWHIERFERLAGKRKRSWATVGEVGSFSVTSLLITDDGTVWAGMTHGLVRITDDGCRFFTSKEDGLANDCVQALALDGEVLWVGTANGLSRFTISENQKGTSQ